MTLAFNDIEHMIDMWVPSILGNPEASVAFLVAGKEKFAKRKIKFVRDLLEAFQQDRQAARLEIETVQQLLDKANLLYGRRNQYVHACAFVDYTARKRKLRTRTGVIQL